MDVIFTFKSVFEDVCIYSILHDGRTFIMKGLQPKFQNAIWDNSSVWIDQETFNTTFIFFIEGGLNPSFMAVGSSTI